jgi:surfactin synthase thioesterase subunit
MAISVTGMEVSGAEEPTGERRSLIRLDRSAEPVVDLVCFPGAGEPVSRFRSWIGLLPDHLGLVGVERRGHGVRLGEPPVSQLSTLVTGICAELRDLRRPTILLGHSAGSLVAHAVAHAMRGPHLPSVLGVVALNGRSPTVEQHISWLDLDDEDLANEIAGLRRQLAPMLAREDIRALFMPALRADLELYRRSPDERYPPLDVPVVAVGGRDDQLVPPAHIWRWREATSVEFVGRVTEGRHFSLIDQPGGGLDEVMALIDHYLVPSTD